MAIEIRVYWVVVELSPLPPTATVNDFKTAQRDVVEREKLEDAQRIVELLNETSLGDEVFAVQSRYK